MLEFVWVVLVAQAWRAYFLVQLALCSAFSLHDAVKGFVTNCQRLISSFKNSRILFLPLKVKFLYQTTTLRVAISQFQTKYKAQSDLDQGLPRQDHDYWQPIIGPPTTFNWIWLVNQNLKHLPNIENQWTHYSSTNTDKKMNHCRQNALT